MSDCIIDTGINTERNDFKICIYSTKYLDISLGDTITFTEVLDKYDFSKTSDFSKLIQKIGYSAFISSNYSISGLAVNNTLSIT